METAMQTVLERAFHPSRGSIFRLAQLNLDQVASKLLLGSIEALAVAVAPGVNVDLL